MTLLLYFLILEFTRQFRASSLGPYCSAERRKVRNWSKKYQNYPLSSIGEWALNLVLIMIGFYSSTRVLIIDYFVKGNQLVKKLTKLGMFCQYHACLFNGLEIIYFTRSFLAGVSTKFGENWH
jgi:hypothetical protein